MHDFGHLVFTWPLSLANSGLTKTELICYTAERELRNNSALELLCFERRWHVHLIIDRIYTRPYEILAHALAKHRESLERE